MFWVQLKGAFMSREKVRHQALRDMIDRSPTGQTFVVPAELCMPVMRLNRTDGSALRVLFAMLWLSSEHLRTGAAVRFRSTMAELRIACGYERYEKDQPVLDGLMRVQNEVCELGDGLELKVFDMLEVFDTGSRTVEWVFSPEFQALFLSPPVYAIASIAEIAQLKSGLDIFLYLQVRRVWKMKKKAAVLSAEQLTRACGGERSMSFQRLSERVRRVTKRLEEITHSEIRVSPRKAPGARTHDEMCIEVRTEL